MRRSKGKANGGEQHGQPACQTRLCAAVEHPGLLVIAQYRPTGAAPIVTAQRRFSCQDCSTYNPRLQMRSDAERVTSQGTRQKGVILYFFSWRDNTVRTSMILAHFVSFSKYKKNTFFWIIYCLSYAPLSAPFMRVGLSDGLVAA